ncbi:G-patch domain [Cinara cedri]|uniref:G-patch domain n=1 Tax=Cinara cedri TaxID=506608 RepID=A0A5E4M6K9_9HEMI|nr:G-patch domain [Cinara cedri]
MSLAEPRKRRKNPMHSINLSEPNHWTNDDSKFGQKMLEKFGWTKGSGLGKNQQGISENIRVQQKVTPTGLGFVAHNADDWFKAGEDYSRLLLQLSEKFDQPTIPSETGDDINLKKSLVENSLNSKSRVHYHKFTKGKDLTQYKKQELACILGKGIKNEDKSAKGLDMKEYFKSKKESKTTNQGTSCSTDSQIIIDDESKGRIAIKTDIGLKTDIHEINIPPKKRKREPKLSKKTDIIPSNEKYNIEEPKLSKNTQNDNHVILCSADSLVVINNKNNEIDSVKSCIELKTDNGEINVSPVKKKKRESKLLKETSIISYNESDNVEVQKKKRKESKVITTEAVHNEEIIPDNNLADVDNSKCEYNNKDKKTTVKEIYSEQSMAMAQDLIENSSAGKKYCKDLNIENNHLFEKKIEEFVNSIKSKTPTTISTEIKLSDKEMYNKPKPLDPNDKNFVEKFELKKLEVLNSISKPQEKNKHINERSLFIAKHGDILFFGSNLNEIKGYSEW